MPSICHTINRATILSGVYPADEYKRKQIEQMKKCIKHVPKKQDKTYHPKTGDMHDPSKR